MRVEARGRDEIHITEAARVGVADRAAVIEVEHDMLVLGSIRSLIGEAAGRALGSIGMIDLEAAAHAEMHDEHLTVVEPHQQIFGATIERLDAPSFQPLGKMGGEGKAQILAPLLDRGEPMADENRAQSPPHGLDLRQLRHEAPTQCTAK